MYHVKVPGVLNCCIKVSGGKFVGAIYFNDMEKSKKFQKPYACGLQDPIAEMNFS